MSGAGSKPTIVSVLRRHGQGGSPGFLRPPGSLERFDQGGRLCKSGLILKWLLVNYPFETTALIHKRQPRLNPGVNFSD